MTHLTPLERRLLNRYQGDVPLTERPYAVMAAELECDEQLLLESLRGLLEHGWLSRFGPLYNADRLGGSLLLAAMSIPDDQFATVAEKVNALPAIAHNYQRDHALNMWFVVATDRPEAADETLDAISATTGFPVYAFPKLREFYLGLWLELDETGSCRTYSRPEPPLQPPRPLDEQDRALIAATQDGLPLVSEPMAALADHLRCAPAEILERFTALLQQGVVRRIGLVPNHYRLGLRGNGMSVWDIPDELLDQAGERLGALDFVSHCYARPRHLPHWPYNLFAMVHGNDRAQAATKVEHMAQLLNGMARGHDVLFSAAILKKTGLRMGQRPPQANSPHSAL